MIPSDGGVDRGNTADLFEETTFEAEQREEEKVNGTD
jgi:hypothetical protein